MSSARRARRRREVPDRLAPGLYTCRDGGARLGRRMEPRGRVFLGRFRASTSRSTPGFADRVASAVRLAVRTGHPVVVERLARVSSSTPVSVATSRRVPPRLGGLLDDLGSLVVADVRVERGRRRERRLGVARGVLAVGLDAADAAFSSSSREAEASSIDRLEQVRRDQRDADVQLELALRAARSWSRRRCPITWLPTWSDDLGDHRVDLPRHDRRALLELGKRRLGEPCPRA